MNNLDNIREIFNLTLEDVANMLNIKKQSVSEWSKNNKIPEKRIKELSELLNIPEEYFNKEISEVDKIKLQNIKLEQDIKNSIFEYEREIYDNETDETITTISDIAYNKDLERLYEINNIKINKLNLLKKIDTIISKYNNEEGNELILDKSYEEVFIDIFNRLANVVDSQEQDFSILYYILRALELTSSLENINKYIGKEYPERGNITDENKYVQQIVNIIKELKSK
jgi:transcriptional regulator with XRE-family HTH domain